jgi:hypothetical protein
VISRRASGMTEKLRLSVNSAQMISAYEHVTATVVVAISQSGCQVMGRSGMALAK